MANYVLLRGQLYNVDELSHHGIKGMKWGRRRYQNADGSLKPAGRKRYSDDVYEKKTAYKQSKKDYKNAKKEYDNSPEGQAAAAARRKKALKVGAAVAGTALAAYGAYKLHDYVKTKNCQIAAERGRKFAVDEFFASQDRARTEFVSNKSMLSTKVETNVNAYARSSARTASKDSFGKAAKNVMAYKKSGGNLSGLASLDRYKDDDWFRYASARR